MPPPKKYGDARLYSWWPDVGGFYCWLCLKTATDEHVAGAQHTKHRDDAASWLMYNLDGMAGGWRKATCPDDWDSELRARLKLFEDDEGPVAMDTKTPAAASATSPSPRSRQDGGLRPVLKRLEDMEVKCHRLAEELGELTVEVATVTRLVRETEA